MPLQKLNLKICHSNFLIPLYMPFSPIPSHVQPIILHMYAYTDILLYGSHKKVQKLSLLGLPPYPDSGGNGTKNPQNSVTRRNPSLAAGAVAGGARALRRLQALSGWRTSRNAASPQAPETEGPLARCRFWRP
jgi:hypothetical protein